MSTGKSWKGRVIDDAFRREAVRLLSTSGRTIKQVADDLCVGVSSLGKWKRTLDRAELMADGAARCGRSGQPARRWHRHHEHHAARLGGGAHTRDWHTPRHRCVGKPGATSVLTEEIVLSLFGGLAGIATGLALAWAATSGLRVPFIVDPAIVLIAFVFSAVVGVGFGYFPARRAARLNPIDALRHE